MNSISDKNYIVKPLEKKLENLSETDNVKFREYLASGDIISANKLIGTQFSISGPVVHGKGLGRTVGMPTANIKVPEDSLLPLSGVYGVSSILDGRRVAGLVNLGTRPSVDDSSKITIEVYFLDFEGDLYGREISISFLHYLRPILKLPGIEAVKEQVLKDVVAFKEFLKEENC
ncbi:MAG: riboflavin kinase [Spirochaetales bacterium]|nr:riboflavin kinase [Spirochaetales bacterium]